MGYNFDPGCADLARHFIADYEKGSIPVKADTVSRLAQEIQDTIEQFIEREFNA